MEYLLETEYADSFFINNDSHPLNYISISNGSYIFFDLSFINNTVEKYDLIFRATIRISHINLDSTKCKNVKLFYFDDDGITKKYVDYGSYSNSGYLSFDITDFLFTKKYLHKSLYIENSAGSTIMLSSSNDNYIDALYYKKDQLYSNQNILSESLFDYQYSYNYFSQQLLFSKTILDNQLFYNLSFVYSNVMNDNSYLFLPKGWNFNVLEYLLFEDGEPIKYVNQDNRPCELVKLDGTCEDYYYTNNGSALILLKEENSGVTTFKLFNEISSSFKRFNDDGKIIYYQDNIGNYFNVSYSTTTITIVDSKGNTVLIEQQSELNKFRIKLNNNYIAYFVKNSSLNILESISEDGQNEDNFYYLNNVLYEVYIYEDYKFQFATYGASVVRIRRYYDDNVIKSYTFEYNYLRTLITDRHDVITYYEADEYLNQISFGEYSNNYLPKFTVSNQRLIGESIGMIASGLCMKMVTRNTGSEYCNLNQNSDNDEVQFWIDNSNNIIEGHTYAIMATLEKNSDVVFTDNRKVTVVFYGAHSSNHVSLLFNKFLRKQIAIRVFKADYTESISGCRASVFAFGLKDFGGAKISDICLIEINHEASSTFWANKLSNDGVYVPTSGTTTIDSLDWVKFDYYGLDDLNPNIEAYYEYSYRDLVRNYINVERNLPYFWDFDQRRLSYRMNDNTTGGFQIKNKTNIPGNNTVYARKTVNKVVNVSNSYVPLYDFEYLNCAVDPIDNQKKFYQYNLKCLGNDVYKTIKIYDVNFNLLSEEDAELNLKINNTYSINKLIENKTIDLSASSSSYFNEKTIAYDNKNRVTSISSLVQSTFEERQLEYLNNYELVSASISPLNNEVDFTYSSNLRHNTKIQINTLYNQSVYSNGLISTLSSNSTIYTYSLGDYGCNNEFTLPDNSYQKSILQLGSNNDFVGYFARTSLSNHIKSFNKYGELECVAEKGALSSEYTVKTAFLYFDIKPNNINSITTQNVDVKSDFKLYKIIDSYVSRNSYFDYDGSDRITEYKITDNSNSQIYKINYAYDDFDRLASKEFAISASNKIIETYSYQLPFVSVLENTTFVITGFLTSGKTIYEEINRNGFNMVDSISHRNNAPVLVRTHFKEQFIYNSIITQENNASINHFNELVKRIDYYFKNPLVTGTEPTYNRSEHITYDEDGNIISIVHGNQSSPTANTGAIYEYDNYNRLVNEYNYDLGISFAYSYDANGNITNVAKTYMNGSPSETISYNYNSTYVDKLVKINSQTNNIQYDSDLNIRKINNDTYFWARGRLLANAIVNNVTINFSYNYDGIRTSKNSSFGNHTYFLEGHKILGEKIVKDSNTSYINYLYGQNGIFGMIYNNSFYYFQKNILGDITRIYSGFSLIARYVYDAFGNFKVLDSSGNEITDQTHVAHINPFRYKGYYYDLETGLYYCNARYYSPFLRRWISPDRYQYIDFTHIGGLNLYAYCLNNPVMYKDEEGKFVVSLGLFFGLLAASFAVGFGASIISQGIDYGWESLNGMSVLQATIDGLFSTAFTALSFTGLGIISAAITGGSLAVVQYSIDSQFHPDSFSWQGLISSGTVGFVAGAFTKHNLSLSTVLNSSFSRTFIEPARVSIIFLASSLMQMTKNEIIEDTFKYGLEEALKNFG